jgi:hypothetical protein
MSRFFETAVNSENRALHFARRNYDDKNPFFFLTATVD